MSLSIFSIYKKEKKEEEKKNIRLACYTFHIRNIQAAYMSSTIC